MSLHSAEDGVGIGADGLATATASQLGMGARPFGHDAAVLEGHIYKYSGWRRLVARLGGAALEVAAAPPAAAERDAPRDQGQKALDDAKRTFSDTVRGAHRARSRKR